MAEVPASRASAPVSGAAPLSGIAPARLCPGCGRAVDPLRAGHVAILDGAFLYYCEARCKAVHLHSIASHVGDEIPTVAPPAVIEEEEPLTAPFREAVQSAEAPVEDVPEETPSPVPPASYDRARASAPDAVEPADAGELPPVDEMPAAPETVRSAEPAPAPSPAPLPAPEPPALAVQGASGRLLRGISVAGIAAGLLVPLVLIADAGIAARTALAAIAVLALAARVALAPRDSADASPLLAVAPAGVSLAVALLGIAQGDARAAGAALLAGLGAAVGLAAEEALTLARREVDAARARTSSTLDAIARVVQSADTTSERRDPKAGETVVVDAGDVVAVDGVVVAGEAVVVPWCGAPVEVTKGEGDAVVAGARVVSGRARVVATWAGAERAWARAVGSPHVRADVSAPISRLARAVLEQGAPAAAVIAGLASMASGVGVGWLGALAVACAVAMAAGGRGVLGAVALVQARAQLRALAQGAAFRDARAFDAAGRAAIAVVCSRGTVLTGEPEIVALEPVTPRSGAGESDSRILALAAGAETASTHPFAAAILRASRTRGVRPESVRSATVHAGLGVTALSSTGERLVVGSRALLLQEKVSVAVAEARASELEAQGRSVLLVALAGKLLGLVALQDGLRAGARAAVQRLHDARIEPVLLSGESRETCETIARALDIEHVRPEVLPADRAGEVRALAEGGQLVAAIGHPSGDDGALGAAGVAVAMDAAGRAGEWGVSLASDDVRDAAAALSSAHTARERGRVVLAAGLAPAAVALLALGFGVAPVVCGPLAMAVGVGTALAIAGRE